MLPAVVPPLSLLSSPYDPQGGETKTNHLNGNITFYSKLTRNGNDLKRFTRNALGH